MNFKSLKDCLNFNNIDEFSFVIIFSDFFNAMLKNKSSAIQFSNELKENIKYCSRFQTILIPLLI